MNPQEMHIFINSLQSIAILFSSLGIPGLLALALSGPIVVLCAILVVGYLHDKHLRDMVDVLRIEHKASLEAYRSDMGKALKELGEYQHKTDQYYRDNVELVKDAMGMAKNLQDVVVSNTRSMEHLTTIIEARREHER